MVEFEVNHDGEETLGQPNSVNTDGEGSSSPIGLMDIVDLDQAEVYVRGLRNKSWVDIRLVDPQSKSHKLLRDRRTANAYARMEIARRLFDISPHLHTEYTPEQTQQANLTIELILEVRDRIAPTDLGHLGSPADVWADKMAEILRKRREAEQRDNIVDFPLSGA